MQKLSRFLETESFADVDWQPLALEIEQLTSEKRRIEEGSNVLQELREGLRGVDAELEALRAKLSDADTTMGGLEDKRTSAVDDLSDARALAAGADETLKARDFPLLHAEYGDAVDALPLKSLGPRESEIRDDLTSKIDAADKTAQRLAEKIIKAMKDYVAAYPADTREADASVESAGEFRAMLTRLETDDLPRFERRFKELLNENTIREVANFQSQLHRERQSIHERIDVINTSLHGIDYNDGRFIRLEACATTDAEVRDFQQQLRACTEGALTGSEDEAYSEQKFLHVKQIIERFRGRQGTADLDERWTRKVTDVRNWFVFAASERWREDDREHEHYTDSGGKSGGQKEKLAYTVLAASLAYQFGLETVEDGQARARTFRFVVIDEAFGRSADASTRYGLELFGRLRLQLLIVTPLQKIHIIDPYVSGVAFVHNAEGRCSMVRNLTISEYRAEARERRLMRTGDASANVIDDASGPRNGAPPT